VFPEDQTLKIRLHKFLSEAGLFSRRKAEEIISQKKIKVNSQIITEKVFFVDPVQDRVYYKNRLVKLPEEKILLAFNKPPKVLCSKKTDQLKKKLIYDFLPEKYQSLKYIGRLDFDSEGLLLLTNSGNLLNLLAHPSNSKEKTYLVWLSKEINLKDLKKLTNGLKLSDGFGKFLEAKSLKEQSLVKVKINEGRKRFIRRMFKKLGYQVQRLKRIQIDKIRLEETNLKPGEYKLIKNTISKQAKKSEE